jgi:hypothetical protein
VQIIKKSMGTLIVASKVLNCEISSPVKNRAMVPRKAVKANPADASLFMLFLSNFILKL